MPISSGNKKKSIHLGLLNINQDFKEKEVAARAKDQEMPYINLLKTPFNPDILSLVPKEVSLAAEIVPFYILGKKIRVAVTDSENIRMLEVVDLLREKYTVTINLCSEESLAFAQEGYEKQFYHEEESIVANVDEEKDIDREKILKDAEGLPERISGQKSDAALNQIHELVMTLSLSDLHLEPQEDGVRARGRIDGVLRPLFLLSNEQMRDIGRQIKHDSGLKYNLVDIPQDGKYSFLLNDRSIDVRVSSFPTTFGETIVLRFLDAKKGIVPLEKLGLSPHAQEIFERGIATKGGLILVTGPTGSGKTTTLYSALDTLNSTEKKIATLENPVEFRLKGVLQSGIKKEKGFDFPTGLRSLLRQDPDIILIGEIRDKETAETTVQAALTGHVVFSTLHTNSAADAIPRLLNMGVQPFILAPALRMILAQRLLRKICSHCKTEKEITNREKEILLTSETAEQEDIPKTLWKSHGCKVCGQTGYKGQMAIVEILEMNDTLGECIFQGSSSREILQKAKKEGMLTMWDEGVKKVILGETDIEELERKLEVS